LANSEHCKNHETKERQHPAAQSSPVHVMPENPAWRWDRRLIHGGAGILFVP